MEIRKTNRDLGLVLTGVIYLCLDYDISAVKNS